MRTTTNWRPCFSGREAIMGSTVATVVVLMLSTVTDLLDTFDVSIMRARTMGLLGKAARSRHGVGTESTPPLLPVVRSVTCTRPRVVPRRARCTVECCACDDATVYEYLINYKRTSPSAIQAPETMSHAIPFGARPLGRFAAHTQPPETASHTLPFGARPLGRFAIEATAFTAFTAFTALSFTVRVTRLFDTRDSKVGGFDKYLTSNVAFRLHFVTSAVNSRPLNSTMMDDPIPISMTSARARFASRKGSALSEPADPTDSLDDAETPEGAEASERTEALSETRLRVLYFELLIEISHRLFFRDRVVCLLRAGFS